MHGKIVLQKIIENVRWQAKRQIFDFYENKLLVIIPDKGHNRLKAKKVERKLMENFTIHTALDAYNRGIKLDNKF